MTEFREFQDGELIAGTRYRVLRLLGVGGMGSVYEVEHIELGKRFVLKALLRELSRRDDLVQRLRNEWRALARLQHANIVNVTDAGTSGSGVPFYVMERLDGHTLADFLQQKRRLHVLEAVNIAASVLEALSAAHEIGIIHRDVKPANVFIVSGGGVKLLDFGIAKIADASSVVTARGLAVGTPRYMSPEQARGEGIDGRSDVYASALILFEMIAGVGPFEDVRDSNELLLAHMAREAPLLSSLVNGVSPELERILADMLAKDCRQRPAHARDAAEQLRSFARRQSSPPATDATTARAGYGAQTAASSASARESVPSPARESITRAEGAARPPHARDAHRDANRADDSLTQRMAVTLGSTQTTLSSVFTGEALSVSPAVNTTFVSPPSFDGTTTLQMSSAGPRTPSSVPAPRLSPASIGPASIGPAPTSTARLSTAPSAPSERPETTEMLGEPEAPALVEPPPTRTQVPLPERGRPLSITPPPVVDTGRAEDGAAPREPQRGRWAALSALGLAALVALGLLARQFAVPGEGSSPVAAAATMAAGTAAAVAGTAAPTTPAPLNAPSPISPVSPDPARNEPSPDSARSETSPALAPPTAAPSAAAAASARRLGLTAPGASAQNIAIISTGKRLKGAASASRTLSADEAKSVNFKGLARTAAAAKGSAPQLPGSGL